MKLVSDKIHIEEHMPGVTLGVIALPHGLIQIDAPPSVDDGRAWRASLMNLSSGVDRILINLDSHFDRTLGARAMDCPIIAHEKVAEAFRSRPSSVKTQVEETGADWESIPGIGTVRWSPPEITFTGNMAVQWNDTAVLIQNHEGPCPGASWVIVPNEKVVFIGDLATKNQPPYFSTANFSEWLASIDHLLANYSDYKIISGRGGQISVSDVEQTANVINLILAEISKGGTKNNANDLAEKLTQTVVDLYSFPAKHKKQYELRLLYGLKQYLVKHLRSNQPH